MSNELQNSGNWTVQRQISVSFFIVGDLYLFLYQILIIQNILNEAVSMYKSINKGEVLEFICAVRPVG